MRNVSDYDARIFIDESRRRCNELGLQVIFDADATTASTFRGGVVFPVFRTPMSYEDWVYQRYYTVHEVGHRLREGTFDLLEKHRPKMTDNQFGLWNIVEDELQEDGSRRKWRGDRKTLVEGRTLHVMRQVKDAKEAGSNCDSISGRMVAAYCAAMLYRKPWHKDIEALIMLMLDAFGSQAHEWYDKILKAGLPRMLEPMSVEDGMAVSNKWYDFLFKGENTPSKQEQEQAKPNPNDPATNTSEGSECSNSEGQESQENQSDAAPEGGEVQQNKGEEGKCGEGKSDGEKGEGEGQPCPQGHSIHWTQLVHDNHEDKHEYEDRYEVPGLQVDYTGWRPGASVAFYGKSETEWTRPHIERHYWNANPPVNLTYSGAGRTVATAMRHKLQALVRHGWERNRLTGKRLNKRAFPRLLTGTNERNRAVFQRKSPVLKLDTAIVISLDWSTSMREFQRAKIAADSCATIVDVVSQVLRCPVAVVAHAFNANGRRHPVLHLIKDFDERVTGPQIIHRLSMAGMGGTNEADCLLSCADMLMKRKESRRVILALSDGQPLHSAPGGEAGSNLHAAVKYVRGLGLELYGIGIGYSGVKPFYGDNSKVINSIQTMPSDLIEVVETFLDPRVLKNTAGRAA